MWKSFAHASAPQTRPFRETAPCLPTAGAPVLDRPKPSAELQSTRRTIETCEPLSKRLVQTQQYHLPLQHDTRPTMRQAQFNAPEGAQDRCSNVPEEEKKGKVKAFTFLHLNQRNRLHP